MFVIEYVPIYSIGMLEMNISRVQTTVYIKLKTAVGCRASVAAGSFIRPPGFVRPRSARRGATRLDEYCLQMHRINNENVWLMPLNCIATFQYFITT